MFLSPASIGTLHSSLCAGMVRVLRPPAPRNLLLDILCDLTCLQGYTELLALMEKRRAAGKEDITLDCYGNGEDLEAVSSWKFRFMVWSLVLTDRSACICIALLFNFGLSSAMAAAFQPLSSNCLAQRHRRWIACRLVEI